MLNLNKNKLSKGEQFAVVYHNVFDFPLSLSNLIKWKVEEKSIRNTKKNISIINKKGFYYIEGREGLVYKRLLRKRISVKKMQIALKATKILKLIPTVIMVAVTGSLAMENSTEDSDIDLMIITKQGTLWSTRLLVYLSFIICHLPFRRPLDNKQKDALCLNMWIDETDLVWKKNDRNIYTAHEIAQIIPLVNKNKTYERFILLNKWILNFWPNAVRITKLQSDKVTKNNIWENSVTMYLCNLTTSQVEKLAFQVQYHHMKSKITREVITPTRAFFHPNDWGKYVLSKI